MDTHDEANAQMRPDVAAVKTEKPLSRWHRLTPDQRAAQLAKQKAKRLENPEARAAYQKEYAAKNRDKISAYQKQYQRDNRERLNAQSLARSRKNVERRREIVRRSAAKNRIKTNARIRDKYWANPEASRAQSNAYYQNRYSTKERQIKARKRASEIAALVPRTKEFFLYFLNYDPLTGVFTHKRLGRKIGTYTNKKGYLGFGINQRSYLAHRVAWVICHGYWPTKQIDHINRKPSDNRIENLREATNSQNQQNMVKAMVTNKTTGVLGVCRPKTASGFVASITVNKRLRNLGTFQTIEEAQVAYLKAKAELHEFAPK